MQNYSKDKNENGSIEINLNCQCRFNLQEISNKISWEPACSNFCKSKIRKEDNDILDHLF